MYTYIGQVPTTQVILFTSTCRLKYKNLWCVSCNFIKIPNIVSFITFFYHSRVCRVVHFYENRPCKNPHKKAAFPENIKPNVLIQVPEVLNYNNL